MKKKTADTLSHYFVTPQWIDEKGNVISALFYYYLCVTRTNVPWAVDNTWNTVCQA